jgi:hypothetical protein
VKVTLNHHFINIFSRAITIQDNNTNFNYIACKWVSQIFNYMIYVLETIQNIICKWIPTGGGYGGSKNVPTPTTPDGWKNHSLRYPSGEKIPHTHTLIWFLPAGKRVEGTHWLPYLTLSLSAPSKTASTSPNAMRQENQALWILTCLTGARKETKRLLSWHPFASCMHTRPKTICTDTQN